MALITRSQDPILSSSLYITKNLPSFQFENALTQEEREFLPLRARSHAILVSQCALATAIVNIFKTTKRIVLQNLNLGKSQEEEDTNTFSVGIIGCGRLGSQIANCLLTYGQLEAGSLQISTRRPELLGDLTQKGIQCYYDNRKLTSSVDIVILCVLPSQVPTVAQEIKNVVRQSLTILCPYSSFSLSRLQKLIGSDNLIPFGLHYSDVDNLNYSFNVTVNKALENKCVVLGTCPLGVAKEDLLVYTDERVAECLILAVANMCTNHGCSVDQTLTITSHCVFDENVKKKGRSSILLTEEDFGSSKLSMTQQRIFPHFNLVDSYKCGTPLLKRLLASQTMQNAFASRYLHIFDDYFYKLTFGHLQ